MVGLVLITGSNFFVPQVNLPASPEISPAIGRRPTFVA